MKVRSVIQGKFGRLESGSWVKVLLGTTIVGAMAASPASAVIVDDFESYATGSFPGTNWSNPDAASLTDVAGQTLDIQNNANNISGNHLQFATTFNADTAQRSLDIALTADGDYVQVAVNIVSGRTLASMFLTGSPFAGGTGTGAAEPPVAIGLSSEPGAEAFTTQHNGVFDAGERVTGTTPSLNTWYFLRATMRDNGGVDGVLDSYDFNIYDASMNPLASKLGISFVGGEGPIGNIALRSYEQSGTANAVVLFDQITTNVPEPSSMALIALGGLVLASRRRNTGAQVA